MKLPYSFVFIFVPSPPLDSGLKGDSPLSNGGDGLYGDRGLSVHDKPPGCNLRPSPVEVSDSHLLNERSIPFLIPTEEKVVPKTFEAIRIEDMSIAPQL